MVACTRQHRQCTEFVLGLQSPFFSGSCVLNCVSANAGISRSSHGNVRSSAFTHNQLTTHAARCTFYLWPRLKQINARSYTTPYFRGIFNGSVAKLRRFRCEFRSVGHAARNRKREKKNGEQVLGRSYRSCVCVLAASEWYAWAWHLDGGSVVNLVFTSRCWLCGETNDEDAAYLRLAWVKVMVHANAVVFWRRAKKRFMWIYGRLPSIYSNNKKNAVSEFPN